ncbi:carbohydrate-binding family 9-like protein [Flavobacterium algicola]|uniref:carbohydrate-binding family 9-like protein n=1 Tax=Flavobacterium algicola TaxID=556529 RepID=UPI001EFC924A|nr:carbohydrate-binding family 9-like protein [Flavobacterium algicola]MCG9793106.1 hypothetical protein [Flavobacterium algicola]
MKKYLKVPNLNSSLDNEINLEHLLEKANYQYLDQKPWGNVDDAIKVRFKIAHGNNAIYLYYDITEPEMKATYLNHNEAICRDSCVEFFIGLEGETNYYNFEFNYLGSCLAAYGEDRYDRKRIDKGTIDLIEVESNSKRIKQGERTLFNWGIFIKIPIETFVFSELKTFANTAARANFYKCGDDLLQPHHITWSQVQSDKPDFHLQSYFGDIVFE